MCIKEKKKRARLLLSGVAKITGAKDTHEKERESKTEKWRRGKGVERGAREGEEEGDSEIIIIIEVVFQGQYLRFFLDCLSEA